MRTGTIEAEGPPVEIDVATKPRRRALSFVVIAALAAVTLGIGLQLLLVLMKMAAGAPLIPAAVVSDVAGGVSWSTLVCSGVALGVGAARHRAALMGLLGLVCAPVAFACAKGVQRGVDVLMDAPAGPMNLLLVHIGLVKMIEYGLLGIAIAWLIGAGRSTPLRHAAIGLGFGVVFGSVVLALQLAAAPGGVLPTPKLLGLLVNELLFPVGCAMVLHMIVRLSDEAAGRTSPPDLTLT